jgi:hypothetical protein
MVWPVTLRVGPGDFAVPAGHYLAAVRLVAACSRTDDAGGFFLVSILCNFRRSPSFSSRAMMLAGIWPALSRSSCCPGHEVESSIGTGQRSLETSVEKAGGLDHDLAGPGHDLGHQLA